MKYRIGDFLKRVRVPVEIEDGKIYKRVTIKIKHQGISIRDEVFGIEIGTKSQFIVKEGLFLMSKIDARYGAFGTIPAEVNGGIITGNFWAYEVDKSLVNIDCFNLFISSQSFYDICEKASSGTTHRKYISEDIFINLEIELPIFADQLKLVEGFKSKKAEFITLQTELKTQSNLLSKLRQTYLQEAVMGKLTESSQDNAQTLLKAIKSQKAELIKQGKLRKEKPLAPIKPEEIPFEIPDNWVWCRLGDLATLITDGTHQTPSYVEKGRIFLSAQNIKPFRFIPEVHRFVSEKDYQEYVKIKKCEKGDILIARVGAGIGESAVIDQELDFAFYVSLGLVKVIQNFIFPYFIVTYINSPNGVSYSKGNIASKGTSAGNFNLERIRNFPIPLPPLSEQKAIVAKVEGLLGNISLLESENKAQQIDVQRLMGAVLQEAFGGR